MVDVGVDTFYRLIRSSREIKRTDKSAIQLANSKNKKERTITKGQVDNDEVGENLNKSMKGYNGRIVSPTVEGIVNAVSEMIENKKIRLAMRDNGVAAAKEVFGKSIWGARWRNEINKMK